MSVRTPSIGASAIKRKRIEIEKQETSHRADPDIKWKTHDDETRKRMRESEKDEGTDLLQPEIMSNQSKTTHQPSATNRHYPHRHLRFEKEIISMKKSSGEKFYGLLFPNPDSDKMYEVPFYSCENQTIDPENIKEHLDKFVIFHPDMEFVDLAAFSNVPIDVMKQGILTMDLKYKTRLAKYINTWPTVERMRRTLYLIQTFLRAQSGRICEILGIPSSMAKHIDVILNHEEKTHSNLQRAYDALVYYFRVWDAHAKRRGTIKKFDKNILF